MIKLQVGNMRGWTDGWREGERVKEREKWMCGVRGVWQRAGRTALEGGENGSRVKRLSFLPAGLKRWIGEQQRAGGGRREHTHYLIQLMTKRLITHVPLGFGYHTTSHLYISFVFIRAYIVLNPPTSALSRGFGYFLHK